MADFVEQTGGDVWGARGNEVAAAASFAGLQSVQALDFRATNCVWSFSNSVVPRPRSLAVRRPRRSGTETLVQFELAG